MGRLIFLLLIGISAVSTASIFIKLCDAPSLIIAAYRMIFASLLLTPFVAFQKRRLGMGTIRLRGYLLLSGFFLGLHFAFWIGSLKYTSVASSVVLVSTNPIFVGIGGWLFLRERLNLNLIFGILFTVLGSVFISLGDTAISKEALLGDGLALLGAVSVSGYLLIGSRMRRDHDLLSYIFPVYSTAALLLVFLSLLFQKPFGGYSSSTYVFMFLIALIPQLIGHTTFNWALKYLPASMVAIAILGEPIGSTILAYFILNEGLTLWKMIGGVLIFAGIVIALRRAAEEKVSTEVIREG
jgi:drug/metabolite transporter (DMT)-like permease